MAKKDSERGQNRRADSRDVETGTRIRERRLALGLSQTVLGKRIGVTFQQLQKYETGKNRLGASRLQRTAEALNVPVAYFFGAGESTPQSEQPNSILEDVVDPTLIRLVKAFDRIQDRQTRQTLVVLAEKLARHERD